MATRGANMSSRFDRLGPRNQHLGRVLVAVSFLTYLLTGVAPNAQEFASTRGPRRDLQDPVCAR
jgi:hypothetical protein